MILSVTAASGRLFTVSYVTKRRLAGICAHKVYTELYDMLIVEIPYELSQLNILRTSPTEKLSRHIE